MKPHQRICGKTKKEYIINFLKFPCKKCSKTYLTKSGLNKHLKTCKKQHEGPPKNIVVDLNFVLLLILVTINLSLLIKHNDKPGANNISLQMLN